jgi:hypothetical protein
MKVGNLFLQVSEQRLFKIVAFAAIKFHAKLIYSSVWGVNE